MKYVMELTADEMQALEETMRLVRKGGDARIVARSRAGVSLQRKVEEQRFVEPIPKPVAKLGRHADGRHYAEAHYAAAVSCDLNVAREAEVRRVTTLLPPPPSTNVVASTTLADFE